MIVVHMNDVQIVNIQMNVCQLNHTQINDVLLAKIQMNVGSMNDFQTNVMNAYYTQTFKRMPPFK